MLEAILRILSIERLGLSEMFIEIENVKDLESKDSDFQIWKTELRNSVSSCLGCGGDNRTT